jgi:hypothetical protein
MLGGIFMGYDRKIKYLALMEDYVKLQKEHSELLKKMLQ